VIDGITPLHLVLVLIIALIVIGPGKLPEVGSALGKTIREFRKASTDVQDAVRFDAAPNTAPAPVAAPVMQSVTAAPVQVAQVAAAAAVPMAAAPAQIAAGPVAAEVAAAEVAAAPAPMAPMAPVAATPAAADPVAAGDPRTDAGS